MNRALLALLAFFPLAAQAQPGQGPINNPTPNASAITTGTLPSARLPSGLQYEFVIANVQIGSGTGDKASFTVPAQITKWRNNGVVVFNCLGTPAGSPLVNLWTAAGGTGTEIGSFSSANLTANTTTDTLTAGSALANGKALTSTTVFVNVPTAASSPVTCSFGVGANADLTGG